MASAYGLELPLPQWAVEHWNARRVGMVRTFLRRPAGSQMVHRVDARLPPSGGKRGIRWQHLPETTQQPMPAPHDDRGWERSSGCLQRTRRSLGSERSSWPGFGRKPIAQIAKDLGISDSCLRNWMA